MNWIYNNRIVEDTPKAFGFVYKLYYESSKAYIGKKQIWSYTESAALKNGKQRVGHIKFLNRNKKGKRVAMELVGKESNWRSYTSSSKDIPVEDKLVKKEILYYAYKKQQLSYIEDRELFRVEACINDNYYNKSISGRYFDNIME